MNSTFRLTGRLVAAGRALTGVSQSELAAAAGIPPETVISWSQVAPPGFPTRSLERSVALWRHLARLLSRKVTGWVQASG